MGFFTPGKDKSSVEVIEEVMPTIYIAKEALIKMKLYIDGCSDEIGWLGTVQESGNDYLIDDVLLFEQEVHSTTTEITPEGLSKFGEEILQQEHGIDLWNSIKLWGHSHVDMTVFASGQDDAQMVTFKDCGHDWFIRIIANKKEDIKIDLYNYKHGITYQNMPYTEVASTEEYEIKRQIQELQNKLEEMEAKEIESIKPSIEADIKAKVSKKTYGVKTYPTGINSNYGYETAKAYDDYKKKLLEDKGSEKSGTEIDTYYNGYYYGDHRDYAGYDEEYYREDTPLDEVTKAKIHQDNLDLGLDAVWFLQGLALCSTIDEVREELDVWGYEDIYEDEEIEQLWTLAIGKGGM